LKAEQIGAANVAIKQATSLTSVLDVNKKRQSGGNDFLA